MTKALPAVLIFSITAVVYGIIDAIHCFVTPIAVADYVGNVFVFGCFGLVYGIYDKIEKRIFPLVRENRKEDEREDLVMLFASGPF